MDAQQTLKGTFKTLINVDYSIGVDIERYQGVLENALSKVDFSVGIGKYMLPSNFDLNIGKTKGYNNKILVSNKDPKKLAPDVPKKIVNPVARHDLKVLTEKDNNENLAIKFLIVGAGLRDYHCW